MASITLSKESIEELAFRTNLLHIETVPKVDEIKKEVKTIDEEGYIVGGEEGEEVKEAYQKIVTACNGVVEFLEAARPKYEKFLDKAIETIGGTKTVAALQDTLKAQAEKACIAKK